MVVLSELFSFNSPPFMQTFFHQMGYGSRALRLLQMYYEGKFPCLEEKIAQKPKEIATVSSEVWTLGGWVAFFTAW